MTRAVEIDQTEQGTAGLSDSERLERVALFELDVQDQEIVDVNGTTFDIMAYSRFKYGDGEVAAEYGRALAEVLMERYGDVLPESYVAASPFKHVHTAAHYLLNDLVPHLSIAGHAPLGTFRVDRGVVKAVDYSSLDFESRQQSNAGRQVTVPELTRSEVAGYPVVVIDDIRVSGTTEAETRKALNNAGIPKVYYGYVALLDSKVGAHDSAVEHRLTHAAVETLDDLVTIANSPGFRLNARTCKFILRADAQEVAGFAQRIHERLHADILNAMVADGYHLMDEHVASFQTFADMYAARISEIGAQNGKS